MRGLPIALALATTLVLGMAVAPAVAAPKQAVGDRIDLRDEAPTYPALTPFHIDHGFVFEVGDNTIGLSDFVLDMDGTALTADFVQRSPAGEFGLSFQKIWFYNFPTGLTGSHQFTRHYFQACDNDSVPCDGNRINTPVETLTSTTVVTFAP
jgi:hypothetical protein